MPHRRVTALEGAILAAALWLAACDASPASGDDAAAITGDSLVMSEPDAEGLYMPLRAMARLSDGRLLADIGTAIDQFDASGRFVRRIGRQGNGPGEFQRISTVLTLPGDTLFAAVDARRARIIVFETATGTLRREVAVRPFFAGQQWRWSLDGDTVVMPGKLNATPFMSWVPATDSTWTWGAVPEIYHKSITAYSQGGEPSIVRRGDGWLAVYPGDGRLHELSADGSFSRAIDIPVARRRGVPPDLGDSVTAIQASGTFRYAASLVFALWELPSGNYALVHMDTDPTLDAAVYAASNGAGGITYDRTRYWVTFISQDLRRACPDNRVPFEPDNLLVPFVKDKADSVFFLTRSVATDSTANAVLHRFRADEGRCEWVRTKEAASAGGGPPTPP
jgi:hypothetical protein